MQTGNDVVVSSNGSSYKTTSELAGVSETMLWGLHNRASEAWRVDGALTDPDCVRIHDAIDYDFADHFGDPLGSLSIRAAEIDRVIRHWLESHPDGLVVSLGEGLETQVRRVDNGRMRWLSVDLPDAIRMREVFLQPTDRFSHISVSALDRAWMDAVNPSSGVFIVAQGLLMYLEPEEVRQLLSDIADRFPGAEMVFDVVPRWFSRMTMLGLKQTPHYRLPPMPWGIDRDEVYPTLRHWNARLSSVAFLDYCAPRGLPLLFARMNRSIPFLRHEVPSLVHVTLPKADCRSLIPDTETIKSTETAFEERDVHFKATDPEQQRELGDDISGPGTIDGIFAAAERKCGRDCDLITAAGNVIATRVALGMVGALDPLHADHDELARIVPEKVEAFS
ncbi:MAG TPA: class I SAM-dependent methyltransferase, partial [Candidatus Acidoferrales bacterium]|nr:class I SAM-dependent methyltransferase [Candidatus Acidoferrales bacterium]